MKSFERMIYTATYSYESSARQLYHLRASLSVAQGDLLSGEVELSLQNSAYLLAVMSLESFSMWPKWCDCIALLHRRTVVEGSFMKIKVAVKWSNIGMLSCFFKPPGTLISCLTVSWIGGTFSHFEVVRHAYQLSRCLLKWRHAVSHFAGAN